jgi:ribonuclease P protein component
VSAAARAAGGRCCARAAPRAASVSRSSAAHLRGLVRERQARFGLGAQLRITLRRDFERLLRQGVRRNVSGYTFYVGQRQEGPARLGILISRRHSPKAVRRNAIKRSVREAFRLEQERLGAFDLLVRPPYGVTPGREMIASLRQLLAKIGR